MRLRIALLILFAALSVRAADQIELTVTVTNATVTGDAVTFNATTRIWTNAHSSTTILTNSLATKNASATNLHFNLSAFTLAERPYIQWTLTNQFRMVFPVGTAVSASSAGNWAVLSFVTNTIAKGWNIRVPFTVETITNRTNFASMLVTGLEHSTNALGAASSVLTNHLNLYSNATVAGNLTLTGTNSLRQGGWNNGSLTNLLALSGIATRLTNGYWTNGIFGNPKLTNAVNYGNAFSSPGTGSDSEQYGNGAVANGIQALVMGAGGTVTGNGSAGIGNAVSVTGEASLSILGEVVGTNSFAIASGSAVSANNSGAIGVLASVPSNMTNSMAVGNSVTVTETNQLMLGNSNHKVRISGRLEVTGAITNAIVTGTNNWGISGGPHADIAFARTNNSGLANGNNAAVSIGNAVYVKVSGPSAAYTINGIAGGRDGRYVILQKSDSFTLTIANDSGVDATPANRIYTGTGADLSITNNPGFVTLIYDSGTSRWGVMGTSKTSFP